MASPQKENGYTAIANEILEAVARIKLNGTQFRILLVVWRYTYGFQRKNHELSESFIAGATNMHKQQIKRELKGLVDRKIIDIIKDATFSTPRVISFNKNYKEWIDSTQVAKTIPDSENDTTTGSGLDTTTGSGLDTQERKLKEKLKERENLPYNLSQDVYKALLDFIEYRKAIKKPATERAIELTVGKLNKLANNDKEKIAMLEKSIERNWVGVFKLDPDERIPDEPDPEPPQPQFESEEQRQKQIDYVAGLVKGTFEDWSDL